MLGACGYGLQKLSDYYEEQEEKKREMRYSEKWETSASIKEIEWPYDHDRSLPQQHNQPSGKRSIPGQSKRRHMATGSVGKYTGSEVKYMLLVYCLCNSLCKIMKCWFLSINGNQEQYTDVTIHIKSQLKLDF